MTADAEQWVIPRKSRHQGDIVMNEYDLAMKVVEQRLLAIDRIWDLVVNSEAADQNTIAVADIRAALTGRLRETT